MKKQKIIFTVGMPAGGKTTWSKQFLKDNPSFIRTSRDDFRYMLRDQGFCEPRVEKMITELQHLTIQMAIRDGFDVIVDNTNLKIKYINEIINLVPSDCMEVYYKIFDTPLDVCIIRDALREKCVGSDVILKMNVDYQNLIKNNKLEPRFVD